MTAAKSIEKKSAIIYQFPKPTFYPPRDPTKKYIKNEDLPTRTFPFDLAPNYGYCFRL